jgi:hypothetical protein
VTVWPRENRSNFLRTKMRTRRRRGSVKYAALDVNCVQEKKKRKICRLGCELRTKMRIRKEEA